MNHEILYWMCFSVTILVTLFIAILSIIKDCRAKRRLTILSYLLIGLAVLNGSSDFIRNWVEKKIQEKEKNEILDEIHLTHDLIGVKSFSGYTISILVRLEQLNDKRRKYIFDVGEYLDRNRISLFLDYGNNLVYCIIDDEGVPHTVKVPQKIHTFSLNTFYFIHCEYGVGDDFNFMRLSINNEHFDPLKFENKVNIPDKIELNHIFLFSDIEKRNFGKMMVSQFAVFHEALDDNTKTKFMDEVDNYMKKVGSESGSHIQ